MTTRCTVEIKVQHMMTIYDWKNRYIEVHLLVNNKLHILKVKQFSTELEA